MGTETGKGWVHGTSYAYGDKKCRCDVCREARRVDAAQQRLERQQRLKTDPNVSFKHGAGGYNNWGCRCDVCSEAERVRAAKARERRKQRGPRVHGLGGYQNYGCRCDVCRAAKSAATAKPAKGVV